MEKNAAAEQRASLMAALGAQQKIINHQSAAMNRLWNGLQMIAHYAGLTDKLADINNPAQPVADPGSEGAPESTEQALESSTHDNVSELGSTPGANEHVPAEMTTTPMVPGASIPTQPYTNLIDVTAPVSGTETHIPNDQTRIETDVRVGNPDNPKPAFEWNMGGAKAGNRTFASLKLAKLRLLAGIEQDEELAVAGRIEADASLSDEMLVHEISILDQMRSNAVARQRPANLVPRTASNERAVPSMQSPASQGQPLHHFIGQVTPQDTEDSDLFD